MPQEYIDAGLKLARDFGIFAVICIAFIWWGQKEKEAMRDQIQRNQDFVRDKLLVTLEKSAIVTERATDVLEQMARTSKETADEITEMRKDREEKK